jgi:methylamine dehydrogenase accessory protein MauD
MSAAVSGIFLAQWLALAALALVVLGLARQVGVLHRRLGPAGALMLSKALKVGDRVDELRLPALDGPDVSLGGVDPLGRSTLVMFVAPDCPVCARLTPIVRRIAMADVATVRVVFASDGDPEAQRLYRREKSLEDLPYVLSEELGRRFEIGKLPYAVLIDAEGRVASQGLVNSREHIESLFEAQRLKVSSIQDFLAVSSKTRAVGQVSPSTSRPIQ